MKDIVIIAEFCGDFSKTDNYRFVYLANLLSKEHHVEIVTSRFWHVNKANRPHIEVKWPFKITLIDEPGYPRNICLKRFYSHFIWGRNVLYYIKHRKKPDIIYCAVPSLTAARNIALFCKKRKIRFIIDIQDLWPEAFRMLIRTPILNDILCLPFTILANSVYRHADRICAVSKTYALRALRVNEKCHKATVVYLGTNLKTFDEYSKKSETLKLPEKRCDWIGYCGSLSNSYDIDTVIDALHILKKRNKIRLMLILMGNGDKEEKFKIKAKNAGIDALFLGRLPYNEMCAVLSHCDMVVNPIRKGSAASIINKHADYAAAGVPVLNQQESIEYKRLVKHYNMGINCENGNPENLANKIMFLVENKDIREEMGRNARRCAEEVFDRGKTYMRLRRAVSN